MIAFGRSLAVVTLITMAVFSGFFVVIVTLKDEILKWIFKKKGSKI